MIEGNFKTMLWAFNVFFLLLLMNIEQNMKAHLHSSET